MKQIISALAISLAAHAWTATANDTPRGADLFQNGVAVDSNGHYLRMTQLDATVYCQRLHLRLPDDRDFAEFAAMYGAKILETAFPQLSADSGDVVDEIQHMRSAKFFPIYAFDKPRGLYVNFYYNPSEFAAPSFVPSIDRFISATRNAQWDETENPILASNPVPDAFSRNGRISPSIYRERYVTCTAAP